MTLPVLLAPNLRVLRLASGMLWHTSILAGAISSAHAQPPVDAPRNETPSHASARAGEASNAPEENAAEATESAEASPSNVRDESPAHATPGLGEAQQLTAPSASAPLVAAVATPLPAEESLPVARDWRYPRRIVDRPLTLPQGALRFDSIVAFTVAYDEGSCCGGDAFMSGSFAFAAGLFDELEVGVLPVQVTWLPPLSGADPSVYARVRAIGGDLQLAFHAETTLPITNQFGVARMTLAAMLAWTLDDVRFDLALDYSLLFGNPLHQRVGLPVTATLQLHRNHAIALTSAVYVFNDFDDADVPLFASYAVTFGGFQGPLFEWRFDGGFTDLEYAEYSWMLRSRWTFFAYL